uniref:uncharacterized protein isoform X2 n=1 Tax=Myxine glutinosa TaxID=7769 RepID=UPI00358FAC8C
MRNGGSTEEDYVWGIVGRNLRGGSGMECRRNVRAPPPFCLPCSVPERTADSRTSSTPLVSKDVERKITRLFERHDTSSCLRLPLFSRDVPGTVESRTGPILDDHRGAWGTPAHLQYPV